MTTAMRMQKRAPLLARSYCLAPKFCPTNVVQAIVKLVMGRNAKPSILQCAP